MTICGRRTDSPGFFTTCDAATKSGCPCGKVTEWEARRNPLAFVDEQFVDPPPGLFAARERPKTQP